MSVDLKVKNSSDYWYYHDEWDVAYWYFEGLKKGMEKDSEGFFYKYLSLTRKYQILVPTVDLLKEELDIENLYEYYLSICDEHRSTHLNWIYVVNNIILPIALFVKIDGEIVKKEVLDVNELVFLDEIGLSVGKTFEGPINFSHYDDIGAIYISIQNDALFPSLSNRKVWNDFDNNSIDNSELAYLNAPRFNSFLRDLKKLCVSYGGTLEFDIWDEKESVSKHGILFDGEVIYYEDIVDLLEEKYRIVDLSVDTNFCSLENVTIKRKSSDL